MVYVIDGNMGNEVQLSRFGFMVNDDMAHGEYGMFYGDSEDLQSALDMVDYYLGSEWKRIPNCFNNNPDPAYPMNYEFLFPIVEERLRSVPLYHAHSSDGSETVSALLNGKIFSNILNEWKTDGDCTIGRGTPCSTTLLFDNSGGSDIGIRFYFTVLPSSAIVNGKFSFTEGEVYGSYSVSLTNHRNALINKWSWAVGQYTGGNIPIPDSWFELNGTDVNSENDETDPFDPGGESGGGGGNGNFDGTGDDINIPSLPTLSAVDAGFITLFNPSLAQLKALASYMWTGLFDINSFRKIFADPMDCILGLSIVPVAIPNGPSKVVSVGNISTGISMTTASSQYVEVDCGSINISEYWGAYLDYEPYTHAEIYLPYIGTHPISIDEIMRKTLTVKYHVDILSGACTAFLKAGNAVLYEFIGQCSASVPLASTDWTNVINGCLQIASSIGSMVASGGASAPQDVPKMAASATNALKPSIEKSGAMGGTGGMMAVQVPYIILTRPRQALPRNQKHYTGYPSFITENLGGLSGFTEVEEIHLEGIPATDEELKEIEELLEKGVLF